MMHGRRSHCATPSPLGSVRALVPTLWIYEVGNLLARERPGEASRLLDVLVRFGLADAPRSPAWLGGVLKLTKRYGVTFYDAAYHAHAIVERGVLVTADERYVDRVRAAGFVVRLSELGRWGASAFCAIRPTDREVPQAKHIQSAIEALRRFTWEAVITDPVNLVGSGVVRQGYEWVPGERVRAFDCALPE